MGHHSPFQDASPHSSPLDLPPVWHRWGGSVEREEDEGTCWNCNHNTLRWGCQNVEIGERKRGNGGKTAWKMEENSIEMGENSIEIGERKVEIGEGKRGNRRRKTWKSRKTAWNRGKKTWKGEENRVFWVILESFEEMVNCKKIAYGEEKRESDLQFYLTDNQAFAAYAYPKTLQSCKLQKNFRRV